MYDSLEEFILFRITAVKLRSCWTIIWVVWLFMIFALPLQVLRQRSGRPNPTLHRFALGGCPWQGLAEDMSQGAAQRSRRWCTCCLAMWLQSVPRTDRPGVAYRVWSVGCHVPVEMVINLPPHSSVGTTDSSYRYRQCGESVQHTCALSQASAATSL